MIVVIGSLVLRALNAPPGEDITQPADYEAGRDEADVEPLPATPEQERELVGR